MRFFGIKEVNLVSSPQIGAENVDIYHLSPNVIVA